MIPFYRFNHGMSNIELRAILQTKIDKGELIARAINFPGIDSGNMIREGEDYFLKRRGSKYMHLIKSKSYGLLGYEKDYSQDHFWIHRLSPDFRLGTTLRESADALENNPELILATTYINSKGAWIANKDPAAQKNGEAIFSGTYDKEDRLMNLIYEELKKTEK